MQDNTFVPNLTLGPSVLDSIFKYVRTKHPKAFFDCHLMVQEPRSMLDQLAKAGANQMTVHYEANIGTLKEVSQMIRAKGMLASIALKPKTQIDEQLIAAISDKLFDMVLVMTVEPGFGGQSFMEDMLDKVTLLRKRFDWLNIQVDGGVKCTNVEKCYLAGANVIVSGTGSKSYTIHTLLS